MISEKDLTDDLQFLAKSEIRLKILRELDKRPMTVKELARNTKMNYSTVSNNVNKLLKHNHVKKEKTYYHIKPLSAFYFKTLMDFKTSVDLITDFNDLWFRHNIDQLSLDSIENINDLENSTLIETTPIDIYKTHNTIKTQVIESENIRAIFPYLHPEYPELLENILKDGGRVELILPKSIFRETMLKIDENLRKRAMRYGKLRVYVMNNNLKLYLTICDESMSLGLFKNDGSFDQNRILVSEDEKSIDWACNLFEHIQNKM